MRRGNLFRSVKSGGLSQTHLFVSQLASRFIFLRDPRHHFLRNFLQTSLSHCLPDFLLSSFEDTSARCGNFLHEVADSFHFLIVRISREYLSIVTPKELRKNLRDVLFAEVMHRSWRFYRLGPDALKHAKNILISPWIKSCFFQSAYHSIRPPFRYSRGSSRKMSLWHEESVVVYVNVWKQ